jgi:hypothetical protein
LKYVAALLVLVGLAVGAPAAFADKVTTVRVVFAHGKTGTVVKGTVKGRDTLHYLVKAEAGQAMKVRLVSRSTSLYFNVFAPGKKPGRDAALFRGDVEGAEFDATLPLDGDYLIQVYLYRNAARRGEQARFTLGIDVAAATMPGDAFVPGTDFNATGSFPCARYAGQPMANCDFGVKRRGNGNAVVTVFWPDGGNRVITFEKGLPASYDESQADAGARLSFTQELDLFRISIGAQRFEIADVVVNGD